MVQLYRVITTEVRGCMVLLQNLSYVRPSKYTAVRYKELYSNSWQIPVTLRLDLHKIHMKDFATCIPRWEEYPNQAFNEFLDKLDKTNFDREKEFVKLEDVFNKYEKNKSTTNFKIVNLMVLHKKPQLVLDYIDFSQRNGDISPFTLLRAIDGVTRMYPETGLSWINEFLQKVPIEHHTRSITKRVISGLLYTKDYKLAIEILQNKLIEQGHGQQSDVPHLLGRALLCAVLHQDTDLFSFLTEKYNMYFLKIEEAFYGHFLELLRSGVLPPDVLLEILKHFFTGPTLPQLKMMMKEFDKYWGHSVFMEYVLLSNKSNRCPACGEELQHVHFTTEDMKSLGERVAETILMSSKSSWKMERELFNLEKYLHRYGPFDVVVDTLNLTTGKPLQIRDLMEQILNFVERDLRRPTPKILFISKLKHHGSWRDQPKDCYQYTLRMKGSTDDLLVMLATLKSGPDTYFISNDLYSDHLQNADPVTYFAVMQWKRARKISFKTRLRTDLPAEISLSMPFPFESVTQETDNAWHVPYQRPDGLYKHKTSIIHPDGDKFLCIRKMEDWQPSSLYTKMFMNSQSKYKVKKLK